LDKEGDLIGYCCFGSDARVPGGDYSQTEPEVLDIGVGLRPDLTGRGLGREFVKTILDFANLCFQPAYFRVAVAAFNQRSRKTFQKLGFVVQDRFKKEPGEIEFIQLVKPAQEDDNG
jgi:RimJ/RimL family protein N-acetyltransferase